ncbi:MAG TPA: flagellar motor protein MotD [Gammaproteobacteria bacterium]|nr:flagellar motor protein MotD [Gammaproteobacteria bacterium]
MARRRRAEHHENHERWLVSYADFITLLFAFFVVMYSISSINEGKYRVLSDTLVAAFKTPPKSPQPINVGKTAEPSGAVGKSAEPAHIQLPPKPAVPTEARMAEISERVTQALAPLIDQNLVKVTRNKLWVKIEMDNRLLFEVASAELNSQAIPALEKLAHELATLPNYIEVEGHTDNIPIRNTIYPSNWELSAARAASVVRLFMDAGVAPERLAAIGFGEFRPLADNGSATGRRRNRRVAIVILADRNARRMNIIDPDMGQEAAPTGTDAAAGAAGG